MGRERGGTSGEGMRDDKITMQTNGKETQRMRKGGKRWIKKRSVCDTGMREEWGGDVEEEYTFFRRANSLLFHDKFFDKNFIFATMTTFPTKYNMDYHGACLLLALGLPHG